MVRTPATKSSSLNGSSAYGSAGQYTDSILQQYSASSLREAEPAKNDVTALKYLTKVVLRGVEGRCLRAVRPVSDSTNIAEDALAKKAAICTPSTEGVGTGAEDEALILVKVNYFLC